MRWEAQSSHMQYGDNTSQPTFQGRRKDANLLYSMNPKLGYLLLQVQTAT